MENRHSDGHPHRLTWDYDRAELIADGVVHALGVAVAVVGAVTLVILALRAAERAVLFAVLIYAVSLLAALALSAAYNMWPISPLKWWLRRFDRLAIALYLLLGWSVSFAYGSVTAGVPTVALVLLLIGGLLYSAGVLFHVWQRLRFQNAIWHAFVLAGASCHYAAIVDFLPPLAG